MLKNFPSEMVVWMDPGILCPGWMFLFLFIFRNFPSDMVVWMDPGISCPGIDEQERSYLYVVGEGGVWWLYGGCVFVF